MELENRTAVITGGSKGIGLAVAEALAKEGVRVFICARSKGDLGEALSRLSEIGEAAGEICDVRSDSQVRMMLEECVRVFGPPSVLVNNAGTGIFGIRVEDTSPEEFRRILETNLNGVFYACHYAIPLMKERGGHIINISSLAGQNAHPGMAAYNASKFGLNGFSEALMQEVRHDDIKVSYVCPGSVNTEFGGDEISPDKAWQLQPEDVAQVVVDVLRSRDNALASKIELRPSKPPAR